MKKVIRKSIIALIILGSALSVLMICALAFSPVGNVVFSITSGSMYHKVGETTLQIAGQDEILSIYKAKDKPFLLLGPYRFDEDNYDFFFVNKDQVIRTATDKGGDAWVRFPKLLFMLDDMSDCERLRAPYWDDIKCDESASVRLDKTTDAYVYSFRMNPPEVPVSFSIPAEFLTPDMLNALNGTRED